MHALGLAEMNWLLDDFLCYFYDYQHGVEDSIDDRDNQIAFFGLSNFVLEDLPQACLQIYVIFHMRDTKISSTLMWSIFSSIVSTALTLVTKENYFIMKRIPLNIHDETTTEVVSYEVKRTKKPRWVVEFREICEIKQNLL